MSGIVYCLCLVLAAVAPRDTTGIETLTVTGVDPAPRSLHAPKHSDIVIHFDRPVNPATITSDSFRAFGRWSGAVAGTFAFSNGDQTVTLSPQRDFTAGEQVMVTLSNGVQGADGAVLFLGHSHQFWTRARPASLEFSLVDTLITNTDEFESSRPYGGVASDLNGDGWMDLTIVNEDTSDLRVFLNAADGTGSFDAFLQPTSAVNLQASPSEPGDFNHDGNVDICVANIAVGTVSILLGNGDGTFAPHQEITVGAQPRGIAVLDVDVDGDIDIVNTNYIGDNLSLMLNDGSGVFGLPTFFEGGGNGERALAAGDMNNDGLLDLVVSAFDDSSVLVLTSNGDTTFTHASTQVAGGRTWMVVLGDVNEDGNEDVAGVNISPANTGTILLGTGTGFLLDHQTLPTDLFPLATDLGDMDGDGDLDWITSSFNGDWFLFLNDGTGTFAFAQEFLAPQNASCTLPVDVDNDGDLDLALIDEIDDTVQIRINSGRARPGDVNGDDAIDVLDLIEILTKWGPCFLCMEDFDADDEVTVLDLLELLTNWGA